MLINFIFGFILLTVLNSFIDPNLFLLNSWWSYILIFYLGGHVCQYIVHNSQFIYNGSGKHFPALLGGPFFLIIGIFSLEAIFEGSSGLEFGELGNNVIGLAFIFTLVCQIYVFVLVKLLVK